MLFMLGHASLLFLMQVVMHGSLFMAINAAETIFGRSFLETVFQTVGKSNHTAERLCSIFWRLTSGLTVC